MKRENFFIVFLAIFYFISFLKADILLDGYLHPGDNDLSGFTPIDPLTKNGEHTYNYYLNNPTKFYLSEESNITAVTLVDAVSIDSAIRVYIDGNLVGTGTSGSATIVLDAILSLASGYHDIAVRGSCYNRFDNETTCGSRFVQDIDDFNFSALRLISGQTTNAVNFIERVHLGDYADSGDNYDIDDNPNAFYPDAPEGTSKEYLLENNITGNLAAFRIFISRIRDVSVDGTEIKVYDSNNALITTFDINQSTDYKFDISKLYVGSVDGISKVAIFSGQINNSNYDDISFGEVIVIPYASLEDMYPKPLIDYRMDECGWSSDTTIYEIKNYGTLGSDYNATALNDVNVSEGKICSGGDFIDGQKAIIAKTPIDLPGEYTLTTWVKFPLDNSNHEIFQTGGVPWWNQTSTRFYNIADMTGSSSDYIYFKENITDNKWYLCVVGNAYECQEYNPQNLNGWSLLSFRVSPSGTLFDTNGINTLSFSQAPNSGSLGLLYNSDYGENNDVPNGQSIGALADEFRIYNRILDTSELQHLLSEARTCPICFENNETVLNYKFDAWDIFRNITDRNISTKIVNQEFSLTIASLDENGTNFQEFNGTVCAKIDNNITKIFFNEQNSSTTTFKLDKAKKDISVEIGWQENTDEVCPLANEDNSTLSSDNFAVRPKEFQIDTNATVFFAGTLFGIDFNATDINGNNAIDYNETIGDSFEVSIIENKSQCKIGNFNLDINNSWNFVNGHKGINSSYSEVGDINITIQEINGSEFAYVDYDDTNDSVRLIKPFALSMKILPHHFEVNSSLKNNYSDFTYLSKDLNMSALLDINITAKNKQNEITKNYNTQCYAKDTNYTILYKNINSSLTKILWHDASTLDLNETDLNSPIVFDRNSSIFTTDKNGTANIKLRINFDRDRSVPVNPFDLNITDINITDNNNTNGTSLPENNATFYYGRVKTKDITTNLKDVNNSLHVEVYSEDSSGFVNDFKQESLNWYVMEEDNNETITELNDSSKFDSIVDTSIAINSIIYQKGELSFEIKNPNEVKKAYIHVKIPEYLWYSKYSDYNSSGDCSEHPCFIYEYKPVNTQNYIKSGDFNGSTIGRDFNATNVKRGVKVFR